MSQIAPPPVVAPPVAGPVTVDSERGCVKCSYNLLGLPISGKCPECGTPVTDSLRGILLQFAGKDYQETLRSGLGLVLNGILLMIVINVVGFILMAATGAAGAGGPAVSGVQILVSVVQLGVSIMILMGYWRYTQPDPGFIGKDTPDQARKIARIAVQVQAATGVLSVLVLLGIAVAGSPGALMALGGLSIVIGLVSLAAWVVGFFGIMKYTEWMARRIPDAFIIKRVKLYIWLLPVIAVVGAIALMLGPLVALIMYWNLLDRMRKHMKSILSSGVPATLPGTMG